MLRVAEDGVEYHGEGEAGYGTKKEETKDEFISEENFTNTIITEGFDIENSGDEEKAEKT